MGWKKNKLGYWYRINRSNAGRFYTVKTNCTGVHPPGQGWGMFILLLLLGPFGWIFALVLLIDICNRERNK